MASVLLFLITLMFLVGLEVTPREVLATTKNVALTARSLVANLLLFPILAVLLTTLVRLPRNMSSACC